ncbi:MAG: nucleoside triphosphate pyrophosphohydrolase family protein [Gammaproteobacteria bacterium]|nr:nucleoside triphosphate pyrophosphohydrolase family protein [Gammaproteobacteria bacterium]
MTIPDNTSCTLNNFQANALRTWYVGRRGPDCRLLNAALGVSGEAGELANIIKKQFFHDHPHDRPALIDELGDVLHYVAVFAHELNVPLSEVADRNIHKLEIRYPDGFESARSINRVDDTTK